MLLLKVCTSCGVIFLDEIDVCMHFECNLNLNLFLIPNKEIL